MLALHYLPNSKIVSDRKLLPYIKYVKTVNVYCLNLPNSLIFWYTHSYSYMHTMDTNYHILLLITQYNKFNIDLWSIDYLYKYCKTDVIVHFLNWIKFEEAEYLI